jgi:hypothetical protein
MFKKIDLFYKGNYLCSTNASRTCREAKEKYVKNILTNSSYPKHIEMMQNVKELKAFFDKKR